MKIVWADIDTQDGEPVLLLHVVVPTLGWTNVQASPVVYIEEPADGLQEVVLEGTPPSGVAGDPLQLFVCKAGLPATDWLRGVKVKDAKGKELITLYSLVDAEPIGSDQTFIQSAGLRGDKLLVDVAYGGGCEAHYFQLSWDGMVQKSFPPQVTLVLSHNAHNDRCKALIRRSLQFDLSPLLTAPEQYVIHVTSEGFEVTAHNAAA